MEVNDVKALVARAYTLIERDLSYIEDQSGKLEPESSADLVRYISALTSLIKEMGSERFDALKSASKMTPEQLIERARKMVTDYDANKILPKGN